MKPSQTPSTSAIWWLEEHGDAVRGERLDELADEAHAGRVQAGGRLVEQQQPRPADQRRGDAEPLAHPRREAAHALSGAVGETDLREHPRELRAGAVAGLVEPGEHLEVRLG